ncbi:nuclear transport factor 2 family protein [Pyxidicoccus xibeiensis]|uniref:nuclear transport factor 2 family protein n=1 Tax=Pyxidicoccus xibeiensis TaxID=2906759 RepID=UPI0020A71E74|nr:nuclear transport factor 2 family protein [Pyxidicoccus xibeiensis]MCP3136240.1 nuclear transport factor 2 family protein [Pyxidicoccus xibeiensis]
MMRRIAVCLASLVLSAPVWAQEQDKQQDRESPPASGGSGMVMDLEKMGPWTRKPTNEAKTKKEIEAFFKEEDVIMQKRDVQAALARVDFPSYWVTDDSKGVPKEETYDRQKMEEMMKSMFAQMPPDAKMKQKPTITVLSDSLATYTNDFTMTAGGKQYKGRNAGVVVKRDGQWKWKTMYEAGWGDMPPQGVGGSGKPEDYEEPK